MLDDLGTTWSSLAVVVVSGAATYLLVIALTRLAGSRSLATMSSFDFAATVAVGSTFASTLLGTAPLATGALGLALLFGLQYLVATLRRRDAFQGLADNRPIVVLAHGRLVEPNLRHARLSRSEVWGQLRQAGMTSPDQVQAVVLERSGELSVVPAGQPLSPELLEDLRGAEHLEPGPTAGG